MKEKSTTEAIEKSTTLPVNGVVSQSNGHAAAATNGELTEKGECLRSQSISTTRHAFAGNNCTSVYYFVF